MTHHFSTLVLEQIAVGETTPPPAYFEDEIAVRRVEEIARSNREILDRYQPTIVAASIRERLESRPNEERVTSPKRVLRILVAAAVVVATVGTISRLTTGGDGSSDAIRIKGLTPSITIYLRAEGAATRLTEEVTVRENDLLQLAYNAAGQQFGAILSIDGRRVVTLHYPYEPALASPLDSGGEIALDYSYRLDDAPGFERFFFLSSDTLFSIDQVVSAAETLAGSNGGGRTGRLELPDSVDQYSVVLTKEISQ